jgi:hypothetical protein
MLFLSHKTGKEQMMQFIAQSATEIASFEETVSEIIAIMEISQE